LSAEALQNWNGIGFPAPAIDAAGKPYPPETQPAQSTLQTGQSCVGIIMGIRGGSGQWIWIQVDTEPLFKARETLPCGVITTFFAVPAPLQLENNSSSEPALPDASALPNPVLPQQSIETILESMSDAFVSVDRYWRITYVNQATARMNQVSPEDLIGRSHWEVWSEALGTICEENYRRALAEQIPVHFEYFYEPRQRWYEIHAYPSDEGLDVYFHDIDDRKQASIILQTREEQLRLALDFAQIGCWDWDLQADRVEWNRLHFLLLGLDPDTTTGGYALWRERVHPDDIDGVEATVRNALETQTSFAAEYRVCHLDGSVRWLTGKGQAIYDPSGQPIRMVGVVMDITERKQTELQVYRLNQRLRQLVQVIQQLASAHDLPTIMAAIRRAARQLVEADGSTFVLREGDLSYYADEEAIAPLWQGQRFPLNSCIAGWVMLNQASVVIPDVFADARIPAEIYRATFVKSLVMLPIHTMAPIGAIGIYWATEYAPTPEEVNLLQTLADAAAIAIQNLHLYEELEQRVQERTTQLQQSLHFEALLKRITDHVRDSLDEHQILQTVVTELAQGLGLECCDTGIYNAERTTSTIICEFTRSLTPMKGQSFAIPTDFYPEVYQALFRGEMSQFCTLIPKAVRSDHQLLSILTCPIQDDQEVLGDLWLFKPAQAIFSEQEVRLVQQVANQCAIALRQSRLYQAAQTQVEDLERLNRLKDDFLSTVSHELRAPMANIKMASQMLAIQLRSLEANPYSMKRYMDILQNECDREISLINNLLDLARLDNQSDSDIRVPLDLHKHLFALTKPFLERINNQQQQLILNISPDLPVFTTNKEYFDRIFTELLHNACKYTPAGGQITVTANLQADERSPAQLLLLCITNTGVEISPEECDRIFDKFYRIPKSDPWKHGGTGLGLALVKKLSERLGGTVRVESGNGQTTFVLELPILSG
jgi:PAS domain S-box-containing protein